MKQAYFIRHGNADYLEGCLTPHGIQQVERLANTLEALLPDNLSCLLVSSPSGRAVETAQILLPLLRKKTGKAVYIDREDLLDQYRSMGTRNTVLANGRQNIILVDKYKESEVGLFVAHEAIIAATCLAIAEHHRIPIPDFLKVEEDEIFPTIELPHIAEASVVHIDFQQKQFRYILPK